MFVQAVPLLKEAAARAPDNVIIQYHLGLAYASVSDYTLAKEILSAALKKVPNSPNAREARAALELITGIGL